MIKKFEELDDLPEYPEKETVEEFCIFVLNESTREPVPETLEKLDILADKQWHTYEEPSDELKSKIRKWLIDNWTSNSEEYLDSLLGICSCFALDKALYKKALELYTGTYKGEWQSKLDHSIGDNIDPYWSLGPKKSK